MSTEAVSPRRSLDGIRVLEFPDPKTALCGRLLAEMGADVVLVEPPGGAQLRRSPPLAAGSQDSLYFWATCAGKRSAMLDARAPSDREKLRRLGQQADVILDPYRSGELAGLGLDEATLQANPGLVVLSLTCFGQTGPFRDFEGSDIVAWAMSGLMGLTGDPAQEPLTTPALQGYQTGALWATLSVQAAIYRRLKTGQGARIDLSLQEALLEMSETAHSSYLCNREMFKRARGASRLACPFRVFRAQDGYVAIVLTTQQQWRTMLDWMETTGVDVAALRDPALEATAERVRRQDEIHAAVAQFALKLTREELFLEGARRGIPNGPVRSFDEVLGDDQLASRDFFAAMPDPRPGRHRQTYPMPGLPFRSRGAGLPRKALPPPAPGQQTAQVLEQWSRPSRPWPAPVARPRHRPLEGVNVMEFCWHIAGPTMGRVLADLGATVLKIEPREIGDPCRMLVPFPNRVPHHEAGFTFHDLNRGKGSMTLNMKHPASRSLALALSRWADIALESFTPGTMARLGAPYTAMAQANPRIIVASISGYGQTGPRWDWPSYHPTSAALSGLTGLFGYEGGEPLGFGHSHMDYITGFFGVIGVLDALLRREVGGQGDHVDCSQLEAGVKMTTTQILDFAVNGRRAEAEGNRAGALGALLQGCYRSKGDDRWIAVTVRDERDLAALRLLVGVGAAKAANAAAVEQALAGWASARDPWEAFKELQDAGIPAGPVASGQDLVEMDTHLRERRAFARLSHPIAGDLAVVQCSLFFDGERLAVRKPGPILGQDTERFCRDVVGLSEPEYLQHVVDAVV